jgi:ZIP family zinc transporter
MDNSLIFGLLASANVLLGGYLVLKFKKYFNTILGFAGGIMLAVICFEVLPELFHLHEEFEFPLAIGLGSVLFGILFFHTISYFLPMHEHGHHEEEHKSQHPPALPSVVSTSFKGGATEHIHHNHLKHSLGVYGVTIMIIHSFIDGFGIGLAFQVSSSVGIAVAIAVIMHNFSDGINTVSTLLHSAVNNLKLKILFLLNILAPISGVILSKIFTINEYYLFIYLGIFSGSILYLAISDILPQAHSDKSKFAPILATILGVLFVIFITQIIGGHGH